MKETRRKKIQKKVFSKDDIRNIWKIVNAEFLSNEENHKSMNLQIGCFDGATYESESDDYLKDGNVIDIKRIASININCYDHKLGRRIDIALSHGDCYGNEVTIRGEDENWVAGTLEKIENILKAVKPQQEWFIKHKNIVLHLGSILLGFSIFSILYFLIYQHIQPIQNPSGNLLAFRNFLSTYPFFYYLLYLALFWLQGIFIFSNLMFWFFELWPSVEFDFGPEHEKLEKNRRKRLRWILSAILLPLFFNILFFIF
jgi:hypothetical protein